MNLFDEAAAFKKAVELIVKDVIQKETKNTLLVYKAIVTQAPYTNSAGQSVCKVRLMSDLAAYSSSDGTSIELPYASKLSNMASGDLVLVAVLFGSWRNAIVWENIFFN